PIVVIRAVSAKGRSDKARRSGRFEHRRARAITIEEDHGVGSRSELVHEIDADDEHRLDPRVGGDDSRSRGKTGWKRSTGATYIERAGIFCAQLILQYDRSSGGYVVRRICAEDDQIEIFGFLAGALQCEFGCGQSDIAGSPIFGGMPARLNAAAGLHLIHEIRDMFEPLAQHVISHFYLRYVSPGGDNGCITRHECVLLSYG